MKNYSIIYITIEYLIISYLFSKIYKLFPMNVILLYLFIKSNTLNHFSPINNLTLILIELYNQFINTFIN